MTNELSTATIDNESLFKLVSAGDTSTLTKEQKLAYYKARCDAAGIDPRATAFQFIKLQGKEVLYALKGATDQLASQHRIVCEVLTQITEGGVRTVTVRARAADGRQTDDIGCVPVEGVKGPDLANAYMKAVTKAKRRAIISLCGLGVIDETELDTVAHVSAPVNEPPMPRRKSEALPQAAPKQTITVETNAIKEPIVIVDKPVEKKTEAPKVQTVSEEMAAAPAEADEVTESLGRVTSVSKAGGTSGGKTWVRYAIQFAQMGDDEGTLWLGTFDSKVGDEYEKLKGKAARAYWKYGKEYKDKKTGEMKRGMEAVSVIEAKEEELQPNF